MSRDFLPRQDVQFVDPSGRATNPLYIWLQGLDRALKGGTTIGDIEAQLAELRQIIDSLPSEGFLPTTTNVFGQHSVATFGTLADGIVLVQLRNDVVDPYPFQYYGADDTGERGWRWLYDALAAGTGLVQTMDGFNVLGVLQLPSDLPASSAIGDAYLIAGHLWAWDGAEWIDQGDASGVTMFSLAELPDSGIGRLKAITRDAYGRVSGTRDLTITGTPGEIEVADGSGVDGDPVVSLADVAPAAGGTLQRYGFDAKGRRDEEEAATAADLPFVPGGGLTATDVQSAILEAAETGGGDGGVLPLCTGEIIDGQPVFVYGPDGRLIYAPVT